MASDSSGYGSAPTGSILTAREGDTIVIDGVQYLLEGTIAYLEDGDEWREFRLRAEDGHRLWLEVEDGKITAWQPVSISPMDADAKSISYGDITYRRKEKGQASYTSTGSVDVNAAGRVLYRDFRNGDQLLSLEQFDGGEWEASTGKMIAEAAIAVYPAA